MTSNLAVSIISMNLNFTSTPVGSVVATTKKTKQDGRINKRFVKKNHEPELDGPVQREAWPKLAKLVDAKANPNLKAIQKSKKSFRVWRGPIVNTIDTSYDFDEDPVSYEFELSHKWAFLMPIVSNDQLKVKMDQWALVMDQVKRSFITKTWLKVMDQLKQFFIIKTELPETLDNVPQEPDFFVESDFLCTRLTKVACREKNNGRKSNGKVKQKSCSVHGKMYLKVYRQRENACHQKNSNLPYYNKLPSNKDLDLLSLKKMKPHLLTWQHGRRYIDKREPMDGYHSIFEDHLFEEDDNWDYFNDDYYEDYDDYEDDFYYDYLL